MRNLKSKLKSQYRLMDSVLMEIFMDLLKQEPREEGMSKSIYLTCMAIQMLEKMGNKFPSQVEIDAIESIVKRYSNRQSVKLILKKGHYSASDYNIMAKAA